MKYCINCPYIAKEAAKFLNISLEELKKLDLGRYYIFDAGEEDVGVWLYSKRELLDWKRKI